MENDFLNFSLQYAAPMKAPARVGAARYEKRRIYHLQMARPVQPPVFPTETEPLQLIRMLPGNCFQIYQNFLCTLGLLLFYFFDAGSRTSHGEISLWIEVKRKEQGPRTAGCLF